MSSSNDSSDDDTGVQVKLALCVVLISFGFKHGRPGSVDRCVNARVLENPGSSSQRRQATGLNKDLAKDLFKQAAAEALVEDCMKSVRAVYQSTKDTESASQSPSEWVLAVGCHAGLHRSVAIVERLRKELRAWIADSGLRGQVAVEVQHRDIDKRSEIQKKGHRTKHRK